MGPKKKVLAVISDPEVMKALEPLLARESLEFHQVANGEACLVLASTTPYHLILAHLPLIDMSAPMLLTSLRAEGSPSQKARLLLLASGGQATAAEALRHLNVERVVMSESMSEFRSRVADALGAALRASARVLVNVHVGIEESRMTRVYETENLSTSGMLLRTSHPLAIGTHFAFDLNLEAPESVLQGRARVVRHTKPSRENVYGMGVEFEALESGSVDDLDLFVRRNATSL